MERRHENYTYTAKILFACQNMEDRISRSEHIGMIKSIVKCIKKHICYRKSQSEMRSKIKLYEENVEKSHRISKSLISLDQNCYQTV